MWIPVAKFTCDTSPPWLAGSVHRDVPTALSTCAATLECLKNLAQKISPCSDNL